MKRWLSPYWWCQLIGWGLFAVIAIALYRGASDFANFSSLSSIVVTALLGLLSSHLMRLFILWLNILNYKVWIQIVAMFLIAFMFSFLYLLMQYAAEFVLQRQLDPSTYKFKQLIGGTFRNFNFFSIWIFIYFSYHYIQKSRNHLIAVIRFENELKIRQLETEKAQVEYQRNLGNYYLMALRYQMNPHFIFNCLNSIKLYTMENDTVSATAYLTKFSKLIRLVMENSAKGKILLASELDILRLYIEMEAMRFKEKLQYTIHLESNVEPDYIELPPLLLQPYVENAVWHGLMPKEEGGRIDINVSMNDDKSILEIIITDNGIGRAKSAGLSSRHVNTHESYGMKVTSDRIALINQVYKSGAAVKIEDLMDDTWTSLGTKVVIQIPV